MKKFVYVYENSLGSCKEPNKEYFYEGEKVLIKNEDIKYEDDIGNIQYNTKCYITNFRIITISSKFIFDFPLNYISTHWVKKTILYGSHYIYIEFLSNTNLKNFIPNYILENYKAEDIAKANYSLPKYVMLKFRNRDSDIEKSYSILKIGLNAKEWNVNIFLIKNSYKKINKLEHGDESIKKSSLDSKITGMGLERTKNIIMNQLNEQNQMISGSFSGIQSLKANAQQMIDLAQQLKIKLGGKMNNDPTLNEINSVLTSIGFVDPVTKETSGKSYYEDLAKQINDYFIKYFNNDETGILSLIDAYCIYNRSRGINTISPGDMKIALKHFTNITDTPLLIKQYKNDMTIIHTKNILVKFKKSLNDDVEYVSLKEFGLKTNIKNQLLSKILIEEMLDEGLLTVDESDLDLRYSLNKIIDYQI